jgi:hypothetical protein
VESVFGTSAILGQRCSHGLFYRNLPLLIDPTNDAGRTDQLSDGGDMRDVGLSTKREGVMKKQKNKNKETDDYLIEQWLEYSKFCYYNLDLSPRWMTSEINKFYDREKDGKIINKKGQDKIHNIVRKILNFPRKRKDNLWRL